MSTILDKFNDGYDAVCLMMGGVLYVGEIGQQVLTAKTISDLPFDTGDGQPVTVRKKMQVLYQALEITLTPSDENLVAIAAAHNPADGALNEFFNTTSNKLNVYNDDATLYFKLNVQGTWNSSTVPNTMQVQFGNSNYNIVSASKTSGMDADVLQFTTFLSINKDGPIATGGSEILIKVLDGSFEMESMFIVVEQWTSQSTITPV